MCSFAVRSTTRRWHAKLANAAARWCCTIVAGKASGIAATEAIAAGTPVIATHRLGFDAGSAVTYTDDLAATLRSFVPRQVNAALPRWTDTVARFRAALEDGDGCAAS